MAESKSAALPLGYAPTAENADGVAERARLSSGPAGSQVSLTEIGRTFRVRQPSRRRRPPGLPVQVLLSAAQTLGEGAMRKAAVTRKTNETEIAVEIDLDGSGASDIATGVGFFDHMLDQLARHSLIDISVSAKGDLHIDDHHTVEDVGIALGQAVKQALGDKRGITRYADCLLPMDEALTRAARRRFGASVSGLPHQFPDGEDRNLRYRAGARVLPGFCDQRRAYAAYRDALWRQQPPYRRILLQGRRAFARRGVAIDPRQASRVPSTKGAL